MELLAKELEQMKIGYESFEIIQEKDGIVVARVKTKKESVIIKYFENGAFRREIENYKMLAALDIPTLNIICTTEKALLMEDICASNSYRLGIKEDLDDVTTATLVAGWYRLLHDKGSAYIEQSNNGIYLYDENDKVTLANIQQIKDKTQTHGLSVWKLIEDHYDSIHKYMSRMKRTLTYNDFYYTNLIVAKEQTSAMMYDYNLLGKGYVYADIRNVCSSLSPRAKEAFLSAYGEYNEEEILVDEVVSVIIDLYIASERERFPAWAKESLDVLRGGYEYKVRELLELVR
ncbi:MAG: hypothetical protein ACRDDX_16290 [Cellulosilyticaceae bacterium]